MEANSVSICFALTAVLAVIISQPVSAQTDSSGTSQSSTYGLNFYIGFMSSFPGANLRVTIGTPGRSTGFTVETSSWSYSGTVEYGYPEVVDLPPELQITSSDYSDRQKAVHIFSQSQQPIFVLAENFVRFAHATFLAYPHQPIEGLFVYEYVITSAYDSNRNFRSEFLLVGCEDNTVIHIVPSKNISVPEDVQEPNSVTTNLEEDVTSHEFVLHRMQTLLVLSVEDLSSTHVVSNKPLTVISGHECVESFFPYHAFLHYYYFFCYSYLPLFALELACEPQQMQIPPMATWGTKFMFTTDSNTYKENKGLQLTASSDSQYATCGSSNTSFYSNSAYQFDSEREFYFIGFEKHCYFESSEPTQLILLNYQTARDQAFAMISPLDQYVHEIEFVSLPISEFSSTNISITVPVEHFNPDDILLDGTPVDCDWGEIYNNSIYLEHEVVGYGCTAVVSSGVTTPSQHQVAHSNESGLLSVTVFGSNESPPRSYGYLAGQVLKTGSLNATSFPFISISDFTDAIELPRDRSDGNSGRSDIPDGLVFGENVVTSAYVNENGVISFEDSFGNPYPETFPTDSVTSENSLTVAPYWSDNDIQADGTVSFITCTSGSEAEDEITEGNQLMNEVNEYIQAHQSETEERFEGNWLLVAHWDHVHPSPHGEAAFLNIDIRTRSQLELTNNYQALIVSDTINTYAIFTYACGEMQWSTSGNAAHSAVVGFNAAGLYFYNHPLSGTSFVREAVSNKCSASSNVTNMFFKLPVSPNARNLVQRRRCLKKYNEDKRIFAEININAVSRRLGSCPCTLYQASLDLGRFVRQDDTSFCFVSSKPLTLDINNGSLIQPTLQCCYNRFSGNLLNSRNSLAGTLLLHHPLRQPEDYQQNDIALKDACCEEGFNDYCFKFFERRPTSTCEGYMSPNIGTGSGDPHYRTFDNRYHTFNGRGEFTLLEAMHEDSDIPDFKLQGRLNTVSFWRVTTHIGFAFGHEQLAFHFDGMESGFRVIQTRPGPAVDITSQLVDGQYWYDTTLDALLIKERNQLTAAFCESGIVFKGRVHFWRDEYFMNFEVQVPRSNYYGRTQGFLGNFDDDRTNEFYRRGESVPINDHNLRDRALYNTLNTWSIIRNESLFYYTSRQKRQSFEDFQGTGFVPIFLDELNITDDQRIACEGNEQCLFDLVVTNDTEFAETTLNHEKNATATKEDLENFPPNISANAVFRVEIGQESSYTLYVADDGDNFTLTVEGGTPVNSTLTMVDEGEYNFRWNLHEITFDPLVFIASDSRGAMSTFEPTVDICACVNEGICTRDGLISSNSTIVMNCQCSEAYSGRFCEEDRDGCAATQCFEGVECIDVPAPGVGAVCGPCPEGYNEVSQKCYDIDECALNSTLCDQLCINTDGSYACACNEGYQLVTGTNQCEDIDECRGVNDCQQICENTLGSYTCRCMDGFNLTVSGGCTANEVCARSNECSHGCAVINGTEECYCPLGFELSQNRTRCLDQNECLMNPCSQLCTNTEGSFECSCTNGYDIQSDGFSCEDINECTEAALSRFNLCLNDRNTKCVNVIGSFECTCVSGYARVNGVCQYIREGATPPPSLETLRMENSINFTASALSLHIFTSNEQKRFEMITARIVSTYCLVFTCQLVFAANGTTTDVMELNLDQINVVLPRSSFGESDQGLLTYAVYIELPNGILNGEHLQLSIQHGEQVFRDAGFYLPPPVDYTTTPSSTPTTTTVDTATVDTTRPEDSFDFTTIVLVVILAIAVIALVVLGAVTGMTLYCYKKRNEGKPVKNNHPLEPVELDTVVHQNKAADLDIADQLQNEAVDNTQEEKNKKSWI